MSSSFSLSPRPHALLSPPQSPAPQPPPSQPPKRRRNPPRPRPNETLFRILCSSTTGGAIIGQEGKLVTKLRRETGAKIHCCDPVPGCNERVVIIIGDKVVSRTMELVNNGNEDEVVVFRVSPAQEALFRVVARVVEVERDGVWCRVVVDGSQVGAVLGKGGRNVQKIRRETGAGVEIRPTPVGISVLKREEMVVITGDVLAMNRALHAVSRCLQDCPPIENHQLHLGTPVGTPNGPLPNPHMEFFPSLNTNVPHFVGYPVEHAVNGHPVSVNTNAIASQTNKQEIVFRLLCHYDVAGGIIGRRGSVARALQNETGASIIVASPVEDCEERVITITAMEDLESCYSPAQYAIICVFRKSFELSSSSSSVQARLLVEPPFIACLSGDEGHTVTRIKQATGASILIIGGDHVPKCAVNNDVVVQISGDIDRVQNALLLITSKLRNSLLPNGMLNVGRLTYPSSADPHFSANGTVNGVVSSGSLQYQTASIVESVGKLKLSPKKDDCAILKTVDDMKTTVINENGSDFATPGGRSEVGRSAIVTKTTMEIAVPQNLFASIFSEDECNLAHMRQISGAELEVYKPKDDKSEGKVVVSGTPNQAMAAQNLIQAFILVKGESTVKSL